MRARLHDSPCRSPLAERRLPCVSAGSRGEKQGAQGSQVRRLVGMQNLGNTCFINATFQALSHCKGFRDFFRDYVKAVAPMTLGNVRIQRMNTPAWKQRAEAEPAEEAHVTKVPQP